MAIEAAPAQVRAGIEISESGATLVMHIDGELDASNRAEIEPRVTTTVAAAQSVIFDLADLSFCDSNGIAMLRAAHEQARVRGTTLAIRNVQPPVRRVFEITGLDTLIDLRD